MRLQNRIYTASLVALGLYFSAALVSGLVELNLAGQGWHAPVGRIPGWAVPWVTGLGCFYIVGIVATLLTRRFRPKFARRLTRLLNWSLLPAFPCGTIVGVYGLWQVDRARFDLEDAIARWRQQMLAAGVKSPGPLEELEAQLREELREQMWHWSTLGAQQAFAAAAEGIGPTPAPGAPAHRPLWQRDLLPSLRNHASGLSPRARRIQRALGWAGPALLIPVLTVAFLVRCDNITLTAPEQRLVLLAVASGILLHLGAWLYLYRFLPVISRRGALRSAQHACIFASVFFALLSCYVLLPGLEFSDPITPRTAVLLNGVVPSIPAWCLCFLLAMLSMTLCCGMEEAAEKSI